MRVQISLPVPKNQFLLILFDENDTLYIIDFDKCKRDYCAHDISYFLRRLLKRDNTKWDLDIALAFIKYYNSINLLTNDDLKYIVSYSWRTKIIIIFV